VVPNTERLVSLISEQFLTITGNVTALADPKLHRYRLASAAAARHAALVTRRYARERRAEEPEDLRLEELDPSFCEAAPQFLQIKNESRNMDEFDFVNDCCEPTKFDSLGNEQCFPEWPSWPVRICCAHHLSQGPSKSSYFAGFWRTLAWSIFESTQSIDEPPIAFESHVKSIMAYHKSGVSLSTELVGNVAPGPLTRFLLKNPEETVMVPHDFQVTKFGNHNSLRGGRPVISPFFQSFTRTFSDTKTSDMIIHFSNPLKSEMQLQRASSERHCKAGFASRVSKKPLGHCEDAGKRPGVAKLGSRAPGPYGELPPRLQRHPALHCPLLLRPETRPDTGATVFSRPGALFGGVPGHVARGAPELSRGAAARRALHGAAE
ncbi:unnamed protein product, partial [Durusdinium trenchii]